MKKTFARLFFGLFTLIILITALSLSSQAHTKEIRIADSAGDWGYPNPYQHYPRGPGFVRMSWVFDSLIWKDQNGFIPGLADSWSYDPARLAYTFRINPKARWHDGRALTAEDVVFTINYFKQHPYRSVSLEQVAGARATDPQTVVISLGKPYAPFLANIGGTMPILPRHIWEKVKTPETFTDPSAFIGSGPYMFRDFNKAQGTYLYEGFRDYHRGRPRTERLIYIRSGQPLASLSTGQADLAAIQPEMAEPLRRAGMVIIKDQRGWNKKLMINHRKFPFNDKRFRQALAYAIDQQEIIDKSHRGFATPASHGLLSIDHELYNPQVAPYRPDRDKARGLIESLGFQRDRQGFYSKDNRPLKVELLASKITVGGQNVSDRDGEVIKMQLEAIGISVDLLSLEQVTTDSRVREWNFDLAISGHGGLYGDPRILNEMISPLYGSASVSSARFDGNPELSRLLDEQLLAVDPETRKRLVHRIQEVYAEEVPAISLYYPDTLAAYNPKKGVVWYYTKGGLGVGVPIPQNKMSLVE